MKIEINSKKDYDVAFKKFEVLYCVEINQHTAVYFDNKKEAEEYLKSNKISNVDRIIKIN